MKTCSVCLRELDESEFNKRSRARDGLRPECKHCQSLSARRYYHERGGKEKSSAYYLENRDTLLPRLKTRSGKRKYNPVSDPAHQAVYRAIRSGKVSRPPRCQHCDSISLTHAHHHLGYSKKHYLDILWLCATCHTYYDNPEFAEASGFKLKLLEE